MLAENQNKFLEGTGSMVLNRKNNIAYCALSNRSNEELFIKFCNDLNYSRPWMYIILGLGHERRVQI